VSIDIDTPLDKVRRNIDSLSKDVMVELIKSDSRLFDTGQEFDLCYVDGDHSYEIALHDLKKFWKNVKSGGVMAFDDTIRKRIDGSVPPVYVLEAAMEFLKTADNVENYFLQYPSFSGFGIITKK
jgi:predicted O-methyltransferase YrrM